MVSKPPAKPTGKPAAKPIAKPPAKPTEKPPVGPPRPPRRLMLRRLQLWDDHEKYPVPPVDVPAVQPPPDTLRKEAIKLFNELPKDVLAYGVDIDIHRTFREPRNIVNGVTAAQSLDHLVAYIHDSKAPETKGQGHAWLNELEIHQKLRILHDYFTLHPGSSPLDAELLGHADNVWAYLKNRRPTENLPVVPRVRYPDDPAEIVYAPGDRRISVWNGDITHLPVTAIVNAANPSLQGCSVLGHNCIDYAIHTAAGPRLREDCCNIRKKMGEQVTGGCKITRGYFLHASFVLHTVGPIVSSGRKPTEEQEDQLASCYVQCLRLAEKLPARSSTEGVSIAFCGVSIGEYGFPKDRAAQIAIEVVQEYFDDMGDKSRINRVIFNVFDKRDMVHYRPLLQKADVLSPYAFGDHDTPPHMQSVLWAANSIAKATLLVIACGAGLGQSMGHRYIDYYNPETLKVFPEPLAAQFPRGATVSSMLRHKFTDPLVKWAFYGLLNFYIIQLARDEARTVYDVLANMAHIVEGSSPNHQYLITTTNLDSEWHRSFAKLKYQNPDIIYQHGHLGALHCPKLCGPVINAETIFTKEWYDGIDAKTGKLTNPNHVPRCTTCNGELEFAIHLKPPINPHFVQSEKTMLERLKSHAGEVVMLEIGAGFETPDAMRYRNEELVEKGLVRTLIRINLDGDEELPWEWTDCTMEDKERKIPENAPRGISLNTDATVGVQWIAATMKIRQQKRKDYAGLQIVSHEHKRTYLDVDASRKEEQARKRRRII